MAYQELIKDFARIRNYMRDFYVYGFKTRSDYDAKSARSYDNERRRLDSWLGRYLHFQQNANGKCTFISVDSRTIKQNPLYKAFKAKSFTDNDIIFHFFALDLLRSGECLTASEILARIENIYLDDTSFLALDESTIRKKLKEYVEIGILESKKQGVKTVYFYPQKNIDINSWSNAILFFSECLPLGVIGSYMLNGQDEKTPFQFKHHYILNALDSEILYTIVEAINEQRYVEVEMWSKLQNKLVKHMICPLHVYVSVQNGRQYAMVYEEDFERPKFYRLDLIKSAKLGNIEPSFEEIKKEYEMESSHIWGTSSNNTGELEHFEMKIHVDPDERFIINRLRKEHRNGTVSQVDDETWMFQIEVYDAMELMPWVRTFIGRIVSICCSNDKIESVFYNDLRKTAMLYGGNSDDI